MEALWFSLQPSQDLQLHSALGISLGSLTFMPPSFLLPLPSVVSQTYSPLSSGSEVWCVTISRPSGLDFHLERLE